MSQQRLSVYFGDSDLSEPLQTDDRVLSKTSSFFKRAITNGTSTIYISNASLKDSESIKLVLHLADQLTRNRALYVAAPQDRKTFRKYCEVYVLLHDYEFDRRLMNAMFPILHAALQSEQQGPFRFLDVEMIRYLLEHICSSDFKSDLIDLVYECIIAFADTDPDDGQGDILDRCFQGPASKPRSDFERYLIESYRRVCGIPHLEDSSSEDD